MKIWNLTFRYPKMQCALLLFTFMRHCCGLVFVIWCKTMYETSFSFSERRDVKKKLIFFCSSYTYKITQYTTTHSISPWKEKTIQMRCMWDTHSSSQKAEIQLLQSKVLFFSLYQPMTKYQRLNTSYLTDSYIRFTLKMESVSKNTILGLKMMVKSGLKKFILKFLHAGDIFF